MFDNYNQKFFIAVTGGGSLFLSEILTSGGASDYLIGAEVPYSTESLDSFVGGVREKYCSESTARQMAVASEEKAKTLGFTAIGVGVTASLMKVKDERDGRENKMYFAAKKGGGIISIEIPINKSIYDTREAQEGFCAENISIFLSLFCRYINDRAHLVSTKLEDLFLYFKHCPGVKINIPEERFVNIYNGGNGISFCDEDVFHLFKSRKTICVYPGSFNPLHEDHVRNFRTCEDEFGEENCFLEISIVNFDKPPLDALEIQKRIYGMRKLTKNIIISRSALFSEKAKAIQSNASQKVFVMGIDTYDRISDRCEGWVFFVFPRDGKKIEESVLDLNIVHPKSYLLTEGQNLKSSEIRKKH